LLLEKGADVNIQDRKGRVPLYYAVVSGQVEFAKLLIERGADVNVKEIFKRTLLHMAIQNGHFEVAKLLVGHGADVNDKARNDTPLHWAVGTGYLTKGDLSTVNLLIHAGAEVQAKDKGGFTPLHNA
ncbi:hypothetical protein GR268_48710, partial [Rhizobium leguminosarum]|nr:hypothetical protein [Rhizobium leguminosarum]